MSSYVCFINKSRCLSINENAYKHLFIKLTNNEFLVTSFDEFGLFKHYLKRNKFIDMKKSDIKSVSFIKSNGILWLKIKLKLDDLIIAPNSWVKENVRMFINELNQNFNIDNYKLYEKYLKK